MGQRWSQRHFNVVEDPKSSPAPEGNGTTSTFSNNRTPASNRANAGNPQRCAGHSSSHGSRSQLMAILDSPVFAPAGPSSSHGSRSQFMAILASPVFSPAGPSSSHGSRSQFMAILASPVFAPAEPNSSHDSCSQFMAILASPVFAPAGPSSSHGSHSQFMAILASPIFAPAGPRSLLGPGQPDSASASEDPGSSPDCPARFQLPRPCELPRPCYPARCRLSPHSSSVPSVDSPRPRHGSFSLESLATTCFVSHAWRLPTPEPSSQA